jgi:hypothetical protein
MAVSTATTPKKIVYTKAGTSTAVATIKVLDAAGAAVNALKVILPNGTTGYINIFALS